MKHILLLIISFIIIFNNQLFAQTADNTEGCYPLTVNFTANNNNANWDFGDGSVSELANPSHIYTKAGVFDVKLNGNKIFTINVFAKPEVTLSTTPSSGCVPLFVNMTISTKSSLPSNFSFDMNNINWNFQDGNSAKNTLTTTYVYNKAGDFDIGTSVSFLYNNKPLPSCSSSPLFVKAIKTSLLTPFFTTTPSSANSCTAPFTVSFKNISTTTLPTTYTWDFGNTKTSTAKDGEPQTYTKEGQFTVKLTAKDSLCTREYSRVISIGKPKSDFEVPNKNDTICAQIYTLLNNKSTSGTYKWIFDNDVKYNQSNSTSTNPLVKFTIPGKHTIKLITTANGCSDTVSKDIFVEDSIITILSTPSYGCNDTLTCFYSTKKNNNIGKIKSYNWVFPFNGIPNSTTNATPKCFYNTYDSTYHYRKNNIQEVNLFASTVAGCYLVKSVHYDTIREVWSRIVPDKTDGCLPLTITFSDSSMTHLKDPNKKLDSWQWDFGDGSTTTNSGSQTHTYNQEGTYKARLIVKDNQYNCTDTSYFVTIKVGSQQNISFDVSPTTICPGEQITLTNTTDPVTANKITSWHYDTNKELLSHCFQQSFLSTTLNDSIGNHDIVLVGEYNGCYSNSTVKTVTVNGPIADFDYLQDCRTPNIIKLVNKAQGATSVQWQINNTLINAVADTNTIDLSTLTPAISPGSVKIKMITNGTCPMNSDSAYIHYGTIKSNFLVQDTNQTTLNADPNTGKIIIGDASTGKKYLFNADSAVDVNKHDCYRGYSFLQEGYRPNTYYKSIDTFYISKYKNNNSAEDQILKMIVRNENNCVDTSDLTIRIFNLNPSFNTTIKDKVTNTDIAVSTICLPTTLDFKDISTADTTIVSWLWNFSDGTSFNGKSPSPHTFTSSTKNFISVTLTTTDINGFSKSKTQNYTIYKPKGYITSDRTINPSDNTIYICENDVVNFTGNTITGTNLTYNWTYVNTNKNTIGKNSTSDKWKVRNGVVDFDTLNLKVIEPSTGCSNDTMVYINIEKYPNAKLTTDIKNGYACASESTSGIKSYNANFTFIDTLNPLNTTAVWNLGYNNSVSYNPKPSLSYPIGEYTVNLSLTTPNQCKKDTSFTFKVIEKPTGEFSAGPTTICKSESVNFEITKMSKEATSFKWDFDDGSIDSTNAKVSHQYNILPPSGKVTAKLIVINGECPSDPITKEINIRYVKANFTVTDIQNNSQDSIVCFGDGFNFTNTSIGANKYQWYYDNNNQSSTSKDLSKIIFNSSDLKTVTLIVSNTENKCKDTLKKQVYVKPLPQVEGIDQVICYGKGQSIKLQTKDTLNNIIYSWDKTDLQPTKTDTYVVTALDTIDKCKNSDNVLMVVIQPIQHIEWDTTIVIGDAIKLPIDNQYNTILFDWKPSAGLSCLDCSNPIIRPLQDTVYTVIMHDKLNCFSETGIFTITVKPDTHIKLPTTFTPNGDGNNDILYVRGWGIKELVSFEIYNRWGQLIFKTNDLNVGWDGYYKDEIQNNDVYAYKVIAKSWLDKEITKEGFVHLMR
jgi:gliding motility-associated-like protein